MYAATKLELNKACKRVPAASQQKSIDWLVSLCGLLKMEPKLAKLKGFLKV